MRVDADLLQQFEQTLNPLDLSASSLSAAIIGYGEISVIFEIECTPGMVYKRLPIFSDRRKAETYKEMYGKYCDLLEQAGLKLPMSDTCIVQAPGRPVTLYIAQRKLPPERLGHRLIRTRDRGGCLEIMEALITEIEKVWRFNRRLHPALELAIDGQVSNWAVMEAPNGSQPYYFDTSTPLFRIDGKEQQDPEPLLKSTPGFLRWIIRLLFLKEVMDRYYIPRSVYTDLAANLYKEQRPDLIADAVALINRQLCDPQKPLTADEVDRYYRSDKRIWSVFLRFRKIDRWLQTKLLRSRYEFILPERIIR